MALARLVGPLRALQTFPKGLKSGSTYSDATVHVLTPSSVELHVVGYALPYLDCAKTATVATLRGRSTP